MVLYDELSKHASFHKSANNFESIGCKMQERSTWDLIKKTKFVTYCFV